MALAALPEAARVPPGARAPLDPAGRRGTIVLHLAQAGRYAEAVAQGEGYLAAVPAPEAADWLGGNPYADAQVGLGTAYAALGQPERASAAFARAQALNHAIGHHARAGTTALGALWVAEQYAADRPAELHRLLAAVGEAFARATEIAVEPVANGARARLLFQTGRWADLGELAAAHPIWESLFAAEVGQLGRARGETDAIRAWLRAAVAGAARTEPGDAYLVGVLPLQRLAADLALDEGDLAGARARLAAHDRWLDWGGAALGRAEGHLGWAAYHRAAGDPAQARRHAAAALAQATAPRQPLALLAAHRLLGELDTAEGHHADAAGHLAAALALAEACAAPYERALTLLALTDLHAAGGRPGKATGALAAARALLEPLGAAPALARADTLAAHLTAAAVPAALPFGLTAREAAVLRLVAEGLTDAQAAERLSLSPRTIGQHLRSVYNKLGAENRTAAARRAVEAGLA